MKLLLRLGKVLWPYLLLLIIEGALFTKNYTPATYVLGWDNLFPEFDFALNIKRTLFAVWQEYRGLGYQDGLSHAANLPHYLTLYALSFILPQNLLRYVVIFGTHLLGGIGVYSLIRWLFREKNDGLGKLASLIGGLVYQYSFATIQMFYLPFEPFMIHFAAIPWLVWSVLRYAASPTKKNLVVFAVISFLASPQAHVPTVFLVYLMVLGILFLGILAHYGKRAIATMGMVIMVTVMTNAYWGLPFVYATIARAPIITSSKNNQMATEDIFLNNHKYGNFTSTALMRSFSLDYTQYDHVTGTIGTMFTPWHTHIDTPHVLVISWLLFGSVVAGVMLIVWKRMRLFYPFVGIFLLTFAIIGSDIPLVSSVSSTLRTYVPLFQAVFRFVFTKFFTVYAFTVAILISVSFYEFVAVMQKNNKRSAFFVSALMAVLIVIYAFPSFRGNFFYRNLRVALPKQYFAVFDYFRKQNPSERIAILPAPWFWAWTQHRWSVITSGFAWFGIPQPTLDRAFDPWSAQNENFYWELSQATYTKSAQRLESLAAKYDIRWFILDESIINASHDRALYMDEIKSMVGNSPYFKPAASYPPITIYRIELPYSTNSFVSLASALPNLGPPNHATDDDTAFAELGPYMWDTSKPADVWYPFRTVFTGRSQKELGFIAEDQGNEIVVTSLLSSRETLRFPKDPDGPFYESVRTDDFSQPARSCRMTPEGTYEKQLLTEGGEPFMRLTSVDASNCVTISMPDLPHDRGYLVFISHRHVEGKPLFVSIVNNTTKRAFLETNLDVAPSILVIPPMDADGIGYTLTLDNVSIGRVKTVNDVYSVNDYPIPYDELVHLRKSNPDLQPQGPALPHRQAGLSVEKVDHPNPAYYKIVLPSNEVTNNEATLILSQSFDPGWTAWERIPTFPYLRRLSDHVLVNNWANGWKISKTRNTSKIEPSLATTYNLQPVTIVLFFLPQLLQWLGFTLLPIPFLWLMFTLQPLFP